MSNVTTPNSERVDAYLHGLLAPAEAAEVERLVETSPEWRAALDAGKRRLAALQALPQSEAPEGLIRATVDGIVERHARRRTWFRRYVVTLLTTAAVCVAALIGARSHFLRLSPSPIDFQIYGQNQLLAGSNGSLRVSLVKLAGAEPMPVPNQPVQLFFVNATTKEEVRLADFPTDARGTAAPRFTLPDWPSGQYTLRAVAQIEGEPEVIEQSVILKRESKLMLSSDKPLYQPGQTIHLRALALRRPDLQPVADKEALFTLNDPQGNVIFKRRAMTSKFGIASADCPLAVEVAEGEYRISCTVGETVSELSLPVEKYVLPKFKLALSLDKPYYQPGDTVKAIVQADYFFGKPVAGGEARLVAQSDTIGPDILFEKQSPTDDTGKAVFEFKLPDSFVGQEQHSGDAELELLAEVTDTAGQQYEVTGKRPVTTQPLRIEVLPESGALVKGQTNRVYVLSTYADGRPAQAKITINTEQPFETSPLGVGSFELKPESNEVALTIVATDANGTVGRKHAKLACGALTDDYLLRTDKASYRGGETLRVTVLGGGRQPLFLDVLKDKQTLLTQVVDVKDGRGETEIDLPADCFGTLELVAYRFGPSGLASMKTRTFHVDPPQQLKISVTRDASVYRPGVTAKLDFTLTDDAGKPTPGALSLAAVDEAVFHVLKQRPGLEKTFFQLDEELLKPVYAIYPWSPFDPNAGQPPVPAPNGPLPNGPGPNVPAVPNDSEELVQRLELERAIFSRTARSVAPSGNAGPFGQFDPGAVKPGFGFFQVEEPGQPFGGAGDVGGPMEFNIAEEFGPDAVGVKPGGIGDGADPLMPVASPITLSATTFPAKAQAAISQRAAGLRSVDRGWRWFVGLTVLALLAGFAAFTPRAFLITAAVATVLGGVAFGAVVVLSIASPKFAAEAAKAVPMMELAVGAARFDDPMVTAAEGMDFGGMMGGLGGGGGGEPLRVRRQFPETLLWRPQLITDDAGRASLEIPLADSITNWRLTASAVSANGRLGALQDGIRVFQPFFVDLNLPVALTRNDEVALPVVVYNYLSEPQTVEISLEADEWYELLADAPVAAADAANSPDAADEPAVAELPLAAKQEKTKGNANPQAREGAGPATVRVELKANEIRSMRFRIRARQVGSHSLQATARSLTQPGVADALRRDIAVEPDGTKVEVVHNGSLAEPFETTFAVPENAVPGSVQAVVKFYPSNFSQLVEGLDAIFQMPYGCFEQTSSTTYPNILALDYLKQTKKSSPEVEAKARQYIHLGYQRLVGFEVNVNGVRGGFDWFGNPPANQTLSAYGLLEFTDMAKVHDVDPALLDRTRQFLMSRRQPDGSWKADLGMLNDGLAGSVQRGKDIDLATTAYVAWGVFGGDPAAPQAVNAEAQVTLNYLLAHKPETIDSPYVVAMVANAVAAIDPKHAGLKPYLARLEALKKTDAGGKKCWWELPAEAQTCFHGDGQSGGVEVTALAALALLETKQYPTTAKSALTWLVEQKDPRGTWHSTQATVLALKALITGTTQSVGGDKERVLDILVDSQTVKTVTIAADQADVMQLVNLSSHFNSGTHTLKLAERGDAATGFQATFRHFEPRPVEPGNSEPANGEPEPLKIDVVYDKTKLSVNDFVTATAIVTNAMPVDAPMVILDLPVPAGFRMATETLDELVAQGTIAKYQQNPRTTVVYLRKLESGETLKLSYRLDATMPVKLTVPAAVVYEYYNPAKRGTGRTTALVVNAL